MSNQADVQSRIRNPDSHPWLIDYVWLLFGFVFLILGNGAAAIPVAAWLFPVFLLRFSRGQPPLRGFLVLTPLVALASIISFWGTAAPEPTLLLQLLPGILGILLSLTFTVDRLCYQKLPSFIATLIFPLTYTSFDFLLGRLNPMGSTGVLAYTQYSNLPLIQIVSVTGLWGLTFLITWFGSVLNLLWQSPKAGGKLLPGFTIYLVINLLVLLFGGLRLAYPASDVRSLQTAGIYVYDLRQEGSEIWRIADEDRAAFRSRSQDIQDQLFLTSENALSSGAQLIVWSEISPPVGAEDMPQLLDRASRFSATHGIYLCLAPFILYEDDTQPENILLLFSPDGQLILQHYKFGGAQFEGTLPGDGVIKSVESDWGPISGVICWDQDFPHIMRQAGMLGTTIMLAPNADWDAITPMHTHIGIFRAIENGYTLIRPNINGLSVMTDAYGRVIAAMEHHDLTENKLLIATVPVYSVRTLYGLFGDWFGWLSLTGLIVLTTFAWRKPETM